MRTIDEDNAPLKIPPKVSCPYCGCEQISANKTGFSPGGALGGFTLFGPLGLLLGAADTDIRITCLNCGKSWKPGEKKKESEDLKQFVTSNAGFLALLFFLIVCSIIYIYWNWQS